MRKRRIVLITITTFVYNLFCAFAVLFCSFYSMNPINDFFNNYARSIRLFFLDITDGTIFFLLEVSLIGVILVVLLTVLHKDKPTRIIMIFSAIPFIILFLTLFLCTNYIIGMHFVIKQLYRLLIVFLGSSAMYSNFLLIKIFKSQ